MTDPKRKPGDTTVPMDHPAGPHATPDLTDDEATPGAGTLPETTPGEDSVEPGTG